jgi:hypothetical protein
VVDAVKLNRGKEEKSRLLTTVWALKYGKDVHGICLYNYFAKQPQQLPIPERRCRVLRENLGA